MPACTHAEARSSASQPFRLLALSRATEAPDMQPQEAGWIALQHHTVPYTLMYGHTAMPGGAICCALQQHCAGLHRTRRHKQGTAPWSIAQRMVAQPHAGPPTGRQRDAPRASRITTQAAVASRMVQHHMPPYSLTQSKAAPSRSAQ